MKEPVVMLFCPVIPGSTLIELRLTSRTSIGYAHYVTFLKALLMNIEG